MNLRGFITALWALCFALPWPSSAFQRTVPDVSPLQYPYTELAGTTNVTTFIDYTSGFIKSFWFANFLTAENGHDYCIVACLSTVGLNGVKAYTTIMDITAKTYYGETFLTPGQISNDTLSGHSQVMAVHATSSDQFSEIVAWSTVPGCTFNLTYKPQGPNLYQGAVGNYQWGGDTAWAFDNPEAYPTGTITVGGKKLAIVPEKSVGWVDFQWGNSYAADGWFSFVIRLDNGVRIVTMTTNPSPKYTQCSISTLMFPDGHHEVHTVDKDVHPSNPWVDPYTNITYFNNYIIKIPSRNILLYSTLAMEGGNTTIRSDPSRLNSVADSYSTFKGFFDGLPVTGYGISEKKETSTPA